MKRWITPDGIFIILLILSAVFHYAFPILPVPGHPYTIVAGVFLIITGFIITLVTNLILLKNKTTARPFGEPAILVMSGPFRYSRNPVYLGMTIILFGAACSLGSLSPFLSPILFVLIINRSFIPAEEKLLERVFGEKYLDYRGKVRRWL